MELLFLLDIFMKLFNLLWDEFFFCCIFLFFYLFGREFRFLIFVFYFFILERVVFYGEEKFYGRNFDGKWLLININFVKLLLSGKRGLFGVCIIF